MSALDRLKLLGGRWIKVGRFEVNTSTGERRPIPGLELGALPEDVDKEESPWSLGTVGRDLAQGVANIPGVAAEGALFLSNNMPQNLLATYLSGKALEAMGEGSYEELRQGQQEFRNDLLDPYRRAKEGIAPPVPSFTEDPIQSTVRGAAQSLPQTLAALATGGAGFALSGAQMADQSYQEMKERGVPDYLAIPASSAVGIGQGSLDKIGAEGAFKGITGNVLGRMAKGAALEGLTETAQEGIGIAGESLTGKEQDYSLVKERLATALSGGMLMGGMLGGAPRVQGVNAPNLETPPAQAIEDRVFPRRRALDYAKMAVSEDPAYAASTALVDAAMSISPRKKREMILDKQTELALKTEWDGAKDRINADPEAAVIRLDLDGVKAGNDTLGHDVADQQIFRPMSDAVHAIAEEYGIGERLRFRAGGDEFILVVPKSQAPEISERLKELTAPRFVPAPPDKALEAGIPPGEAFVQYGASVGWGMDDHSADQEVYKIKASKPERGKLVRREQAEQQAIQHLAPQQAALRGRDSMAPDAPGQLVSDPYPAKSKEMVAWLERASAAAEYYRKVDPELVDAMHQPMIDAVEAYVRSIQRGEEPVVPWGHDVGLRDYSRRELPPGPDPRVTVYPPRHSRRPGERVEFPGNEDAEPVSFTARESPDGTDRYLGEILARTAPYSRSRDKRFTDSPPYEPESFHWTQLEDTRAGGVRGVLGAISPDFERYHRAAANAHSKMQETLFPSGPGTGIDGLYGLKRSIRVARGVPEAGESFVPEYPGVPVSPWSAPPPVKTPAGSPPGERVGSRKKPAMAPGRTLKRERALQEEFEGFERLAKKVPHLLQADEVAAHRAQLKAALRKIGDRDPHLKRIIELRLGEMTWLPGPDSLGFVGGAPGISSAVSGARAFLDKAVDIRQKYFTAEGNLPIPWMQAHEGQVQGQRAAKLAVDYIVKDYGKALEQEIKNGSLPEEINHRAKQYLSGDKEVAIPEPMKPVLDRMRAYYDNEISQRLIESGVARDPAHVKTILENQGEYIFRAFKMHTEPDWAKKMVGTPTFDRAVDYLLTNEDQRLQKMVDSRNQLAQEYEAKLAEVQEQINSMQMDMGRIDVLEQADLETLNQMESTFNAPGALRSVSKQLIEEARQERIAAKGKIRETRKAQLAALQQEYGRKLGSARRHATWAEKKIAENAANQDRRAQASGKVEGLITYDPKPVHPGGFKGLSKAWLSKRKNIPQPLLDVMGEIDDPATGLVVVAERAARSIGRKEMWQQIAEGSLGRDVFTQEMPGHVHKIEGVKIPGPDGKDVELYTSKELHDAISEAFDEGHQAAGFFDLFNGGLKANATIFNPQGAMRNLESGIIPLLANGNLPPAMYATVKDSARAAAAWVGFGDRRAATDRFLNSPVISSARTAFANAGLGKAMRQEAIEATRYGVLGTNVDTRDIADYLRPITEGSGKSIPRQVFEFAQKAYAGGDNFAKLIAWKMERDRYAEAYGLPRDSPEVMARAAEVVKRTIQNYDRLPKWAKEVRKSPVIGPFVSFPASVLSNTAGIYNTIREDIASENPKVKKAGYKRAAYAVGVLGGIAFGETIARLFKDEEEDDNEVLDNARELLPPWMKNSALLLYDKSPGKVRTVDVSFLNYYDTVTRPIQMLLRGDLANEPGDVMLSTAWEMAKKIFGEELALQAYADLTRGPLSGGPEVVNEEMQLDVALWRVGRYALRSMAPGAIRSAARILEAEPGKRGTEVFALAGPRITTLNVPRSLDYSLYELQNDRTAIRTSLQGALKSTALLAMPEFQSNVQGFKPSMESIYSQALTKYRSAVDLGVSPNEARASMGDKMYKSGKLLISFVNLGATPEVAVKKVVEREWEGLKPDLLAAVREKQKLSLREYVADHPTATALEIERRRLDLEKWGREATAIINGQQQETALDRLRKLGAN